MIGQPEIRPLAGMTQELERLVARVTALEVHLAGNREPATAEWLQRLEETKRYLFAAQAALAGVAPSETIRSSGHLEGSSQAVPIQDLLCFLASTKKSGVLRVETGQEHYLLQLDRGSLVYALGDTPPPGEALSELLAARGVVSAELLGQLPEHGSEQGWGDHNLLGTGWVSRESLTAAIQQQTRLSFFRMCSAAHTRFRFYEGAQIDDTLSTRHNAVELLLEFTRARDEGAWNEVLAPLRSLLECESQAEPHAAGW